MPLPLALTAAPDDFISHMHIARQAVEGPYQLCHCSCLCSDPIFVPSTSPVRVSIACLCVLGPAVAAAQGICLPPAVARVEAPTPVSEFLEIDAGSFAVAADGATELLDIGIRYHGGSITADRAVYENDEASINVVGRVEFANDDFVVSADDAALDRDAEQISFSAASFDLPKRPARGAAETIVINNANLLSLRNLSFTTCPEDDVDWQLLARELELDSEAGFGTARGVRLKFKRVPILYAPYFTFPIDDQRKSGFLTPQLAQRERTGLDITLPYYFNLAPNYDLMLEPRYMSKRGVQLTSDFRYLMPRSAGQLGVEYLPNDDQFAATRSYVNLQHETSFGSSWQLVVGIEEVSDPAYFEDMGASLSITSQTHLNRFVDLGYFGPRWALQTRLQNFQTIDDLIADVDRPYERVPQVLFEGEWGENIVGFQSQGELVKFDRDIGTTGWRFDSTQELSLRFARSGMYVTPAVAIRNTNYGLDEDGSGIDRTLSRNVTISSLDSGLSFERSAGRTDAWIQTLEPRVLFVHIPYVDQSALPVFDTILPDFNLVQLFRKYQFVGPDRVADTDHFSFGLTTRLIDSATGRERFSATLGQTRYQDQRLVSLPNSPVDPAMRSDYVAEVGVNLSSRWNLDVGYQWNGETEDTVRAETRFEYRPQDDRLFGLGYRLREGLLEQGDLSMVWPVGESWRVIGQYSYSLLEKEPLERFFGLEYEACCWRLRVIGRRYIIRSTGETDSTVSLQLELKGFSQSVASPEELLDRGILGYRSFAGPGGL